MAHAPLRVVMYGLGAIGIPIARLIAQQPHLHVVGGIERDPAKIGHDLGTVIGHPQPLGVRVGADSVQVLRHARPDVVVIATTSFLRDVFPQIRDCLAVGAHVVSTCEELVYPAASHPEVAHALDEAAHAANVVVLGVGINPGFVMDLLPIMLTAPSVDIRHVRVERVVDAGTRRASLQHRIGVGLDLVAFRAWVQQRTTPHIGLRHSLRMIADALGWHLDDVHEHTAPIIAEGWHRTPYVTVAPGQVVGIHQTARGFMHRREVVALDWRTGLGMRDTHDAILIDGTPPIDLVIKNGIHGDHAAAALVMHAVPVVTALRPGLRTVLDLPVLHYRTPTPAAERQRGS